MTFNINEELKEHIQSLIPPFQGFRTFDIGESGYDYVFILARTDGRCIIQVSRVLLYEFDNAVRNHRNTSYFYTLENNIKFL